MSKRQPDAEATAACRPWTTSAAGACGGLRPSTASGLVVLVVGGLVAAAGGCGTATKPPAPATAAPEHAPAVSPPPAGQPASDASAGDLAQRRIVRKRLPRDLRSIALEYEVLRIDERDRPVAVDPAAHTFSVGDSFLVKIRPEDDLYVYVFNEDAAGNRTCLLPARDEPPRLVKQGEEILLPDDGGAFTFEPPPGEETLVVVAVPEPTDDVKLLAAAVFRARDDSATTAAAAKEQADAAMTALRDRAVGLQSRGPVGPFVKRVEEGGGGRVTHVEPPTEGQPASYGIAVAPAAGEPPELVLDIELRSKSGR
jgi:hypothetical protein